MTGTSISADRVGPWYRSVGPREWRALIAAFMGWALDAMDVMLYSMVIAAIIREMGINTATAGLLASVTLLSSAVGGIMFGMIADRVGRVRALMLSITIYSVFTCLCGLSKTVVELAVFRALLGLGMGGEWVAGAALVTESWPAEHRGKAMAFTQSGWAVGYALAAAITAAIMPRFGWRGVFFAGILPALFVLWVRSRVEESALWTAHREKAAVQREKRGGLGTLFGRHYLRVTIVTTFLAIFAMFAYWGLFTWIPGYLSLPVEKGGAGMTVLKSSTWIVLMQVGAWFGYVTFGFIADALGRRGSFALYFLICSVLVPLFGRTRDPLLLLLIGPFLAFFGSGYFSGFGALLAELFPTQIRATAQGFIYNIGRGLAAFAPYTVGALAVKYGLGAAFGITSACFLLGALMMLFIPETKGRVLA